MCRNRHRQIVGLELATARSRITTELEVTLGGFPVTSDHEDTRQNGGTCRSWRPENRCDDPCRPNQSCGDADLQAGVGATRKISRSSGTTGQLRDNYSPPEDPSGTQTANRLNNLVREAGLEPARLLRHRILSPGRLPIPPLPQKENRRGEI